MPKDKYTCQLCQNHGLFDVPKKGHKQNCPFKTCDCDRCILNTKRRELDQKERQLRKEPGEEDGEMGVDLHSPLRNNHHNQSQLSQNSCHSAATTLKLSLNEESNGSQMKGPDHTHRPSSRGFHPPGSSVSPGESGRFPPFPHSPSPSVLKTFHSSFPRYDPYPLSSGFSHFDQIHQKHRQHSYPPLHQSPQHNRISQQIQQLPAGRQYMGVPIPRVLVPPLPTSSSNGGGDILTPSASRLQYLNHKHHHENKASQLLSPSLTVNTVKNPCRAETYLAASEAATVSQHKRYPSTTNDPYVQSPATNRSSQSPLNQMSPANKGSASTQPSPTGGSERGLSTMQRSPPLQMGSHSAPSSAPASTSTQRTPYPFMNEHNLSPLQFLDLPTQRLFAASFASTAAAALGDLGQFGGPGFTSTGFHGLESLAENGGRKRRHSDDDNSSLNSQPDFSTAGSGHQLIITRGEGCKIAEGSSTNGHPPASIFHSAELLAKPGS